MFGGLDLTVFHSPQGNPVKGKANGNLSSHYRRSYRCNRHPARVAESYRIETKSDDVRRGLDRGRHADSRRGFGPVNAAFPPQFASPSGIEYYLFPERTLSRSR
jgi:hypothetical protein